jgi:molybdate transport system regulatory protein
MSISARNKIQGQISGIQAGEVMSLVTVQAGENRLVAAITNEGVQELQLKQKDQVTAVVKSTEVMLMKGDTGGIKISARNRLKGQVASVQKGEAMGLVTVTVGPLYLGAAITRQAIDELGLTQGDVVTVVIKATEVMLLKR